MTSGTVAVGHPVDVASGSVFTIAHDFDLPGTLGLSWRRHYSTTSATNSWLGQRWSNPFFVSLQRRDDRFELISEEGSAIAFPIAGDAGARATIVNLAVNMELTQSPRSVSILHWHNGDDDIYRMLFEPAGNGRFRLTAYENLAGHRISLAYDASGKPVRLHQELENRTVQLRYGSDELLAQISIVDSERGIVPMARYTYADGQLIEVVNAVGARTLYRYDQEGRLVSETGELGAVYRFVYDRDGRCVYTSGDRRYMERRLRYDRVRHVTSVTNSLGEITTYVCNPTGQVLQEVSPTGAVTSREYDELGRTVAVKFPDGGEQRCTYDDRGNRSEVTNPPGDTTRFRYNDLHQPVEVVESDNATTRMEYDDRGCLLALVNALGVRWEYRRDDRHLVTSAHSPSGLVLRKTYGPDLRWYEVSDNLGMLRRFSFDGFGNPTTVHDAEKLVRQFHCDPLGRVSRIDIAGGRVMTFAWNAMDQLTGRTGASGERDTWEYDAFGQLTDQVDPAGNRESLTYDTEGRITAVRNRAGELTSFTYDMSGNVEREETFDGRVLRYEHNLAGYPIRVNNPDGTWVTHKFDVAGQMILRETSDGLRQEYSYDSKGRLIGTSTGSHEVALKRDILGRVVGERQDKWTIESDFDDEGRRVARRIRGRPEFNLTMEYDVRGRPTLTRNNARPVMESRWDGLDRRIQRTSLETVSDRLSYDFADRLVEQETTVAQSVFVVRRYGWDASDRLSSKRDTRTGQLEFAHDALGRLTAVKQQGRLLEFYRYDANGTILETHNGTRAVQTGGRTLQVEGKAQEYDANGAVTMVRGAEWQIKLEYDGDLQLKAVTDSRGVQAAYEYDGFGRRVAKIVNDVRTEFVWDGAELLGESVDGKLNLVVLQENMEPRVLWWQGIPLALIPDAQGIPAELIGADRRLYWRGRFDAYGQLLDQEGAPTSPFRFRGQYYDAETGFAYNFRRVYDPTTQCFLTPDPLGISSGANPYEYPRNPIDWDDPFGLKCTNRHREKMAERRMDQYYKDRGYKRITKPPTARSRTQGIDAVYYKKDGNPRYVIAEAKYGTNDLHQTTHSGEQMSNQWINTPVGKPKTGAPTRLEDAVGTSRAATIQDAAGNGLVERHVFYAPEGEPRTVVSAPYTASGPGSQNSTAGPFPGTGLPD